MTRVAPLRHRHEPGQATGGGALAVAGAIDRAVGFACWTIIQISGLALLVILGANVVARYLLESGGFRFAQELPERLFPWFIMAGVALAVQKGGHMAVGAGPSPPRPEGAPVPLLPRPSPLLPSFQSEKHTS